MVGYHHPEVSEKPTVLIVDDAPVTVSLIAELLAGQFRCRVALNGRKALAIAEGVDSPDIILLDVSMPEMDGYEVCRRLKGNPRTRDIPVLFLTTLDSDGSEEEGFKAGGADYMVKPVSRAVLLARLNAHLALSRNQKQLSRRTETLEHLVEERGRQLENMQNVIVLALASLAESRNTDTGSHIQRIQHYSLALGRALRERQTYRRYLTDTTLSLLFKSCPLYDIGKVGVPDSILFKRGKLSADEFAAMKRHAVFGGQTLRKVERQLVCPEIFISMAHEITLHHHERWDGFGYPTGLAGRQIPLSARIVALADTYDALVSPRSYKPLHRHGEARIIIAQERGKQFDPDIVDAFLACESTFIAVAQAFSDESYKDKARCGAAHFIKDV